MRRLKRHWPLVLVILSVPVVFILGIKAPQNIMNSLSTCVLVATLIAVTWYSFETRELRLRQESHSELGHHPWLNFDFRDSRKWNVQDTLTTKEIFQFQLKNTGVTPAHNVMVTGRWQVQAEHGAENPEGTFSIKLGNVPPNTEKVCEVQTHYELVSHLLIDVQVAYMTCHGGGGRFHYHFRFDQPGKKTSAIDSMEFWLSDGTKFPVDGSITLG